MIRNLSHIRLDQGFRREDFKGSGFGKSHIPLRVNRREHYESIRTQLDNVWQAAEIEQQLVGYEAKRGFYLEFRGEPEHDLIAKSLEDKPSGIKLLNIQTHDSVECAVLYVPKHKINIIKNKIQKYSETVDAKKPKNAQLIDSIAEILQPQVESFWTDSTTSLPRDNPEWCEVWLRTSGSSEKDVVKEFQILLRSLNIKFKDGYTSFPERLVMLIYASVNILQQLLKASDAIAEFKIARPLAPYWTNIQKKEQAEWVEDLLQRLITPENTSVVVCLLDTGVNYGHPLLQNLINENTCYAVDDSWGVSDNKGHGTFMAGIIGFMNLQSCLLSKSMIAIDHKIESVKLLPPTGENQRELWGYFTSQAINKAEISEPHKTRIICMAISSSGEPHYGKPSSWSASIDQLAADIDNDIKRLIILAVGNYVYQKLDNNMYPKDQIDTSIHDPGQAWNALTVGAITHMVTIHDAVEGKKLGNKFPVARAGELSPFTTTSTTWDSRWPIKPDVVFEGGNVSQDNDGDMGEDSDLLLLSLNHDFQNSYFSVNGMTSAAAAQAAWFAAQIQIKYTDFWPETVRGLIIHSAEWNDPLLKQMNITANKPKKGDIEKLLRVCGYGEPNLTRALYSAKNSLTLISEAYLQPYKKDKKYSDIHIYELPWPKDVLVQLPDHIEVTMRITLSYFIEPSPGEIGWSNQYVYPSYGLRFKINAPTETLDQFELRVNKAMRDENYDKKHQTAASHWTIGSQNRDKGSVHSDIWRGSPQDLANSHLVAIYPTGGWWKERPHLGKFNTKARYALIVSIDTPEQSIDVYTPVAIQVGVSVLVNV